MMYQIPLSQRTCATAFLLSIAQLEQDLVGEKISLDASQPSQDVESGNPGYRVPGRRG